VLDIAGHLIVVDALPCIAYEEGIDVTVRIEE
jgi:hypothetical protein